MQLETIVGFLIGSTVSIGCINFKRFVKMDSAKLTYRNRNNTYNPDEWGWMS